VNAWVLVGGRLVVTQALARLERPDLVIAADGGARHAATLGVPITTWVGDFDSSDDLTLRTPRIVHPRAKPAPTPSWPSRSPARPARPA